MCGGVGALICLGTLYLCTDRFQIHYLISYAIAFLVSATANYIFNSLWTFNTQKAYLKGYSTYIMLTAVTFATGEILMYLLTSKIGIWYLSSNAIVILINFGINFMLSKKFVWNKTKSKKGIVAYDTKTLG